MAGKKIGALWRKRMKDGSVYFTGTIEVIAGLPIFIVLFQNKPDRQKPNLPAYNIYLQTKPLQQTELKIKPFVEVEKIKKLEERDD